MADTMPRLAQHVAIRSWRRIETCECGEGFEKKHLRPAAFRRFLQQTHHRAHAYARTRDERDEEVGEAEVRAIDALLGDRRVRREFLGDGRSIGVARVEGLGTAIGLNAGEEEVGAVAVDDALQAKRLRVGREV